MRADFTLTLTIGGEIRMNNEMLAMICDEQKADDAFAGVSAVLNTDENIFMMDGNIQPTADNEKCSALPEYTIHSLLHAGFDRAVLCGEHMNDGGRVAREKTADTLYNLGMHITGMDSEKSSHIRITEINGTTIAFLAYTEGFCDSGAFRDRQGLAALTDENCANDIREVKNNGAQLVVIFLSWNSQEDRITDDEKAFMKRLCAQGADVIIGNKKGCLTAPEWIDVTDTASGNVRKALVVYSIGDLLSREVLDSEYRAAYLLSVELGVFRGESRVTAVRYIPVYISNENGIKLMRCDDIETLAPLTTENRVSA